MKEPGIGDIANSYGDIVFSSGAKPIMAGRVALPIGQALVALRHGWRWVCTHEMTGEHWIAVQRGGERWIARQ